jgi:acetate kinase
MKMVILTVNTGSSSVRLGLFEKEEKGLKRIADGHLTPGEKEPEDYLKNFIEENGRRTDAVVHRVVHGGPNLNEQCSITDEVEKEIERLSILAPLHNPMALKWIRACRAVTGTTQIAVFDTAFYASMPEVSKIYALPTDICSEHGIRRYGFHGIAHRAMIEKYAKFSPGAGDNGRIISIQLGSGCSITAIKEGLPVDTSMGFSPNEGLVMSTRSGDIDSGVLLYLAENAGLSADEIDRTLNRSSGLLGVSGLSGDMRTLLESEDPGARLAVDLYCYRVKKYIGAYMAALNGADAVLFGGGVGENAPLIRSKILENMEWCGITLDQDVNDRTVGKEGRISSDKSNLDVMVIPVDEAEVMAEEAVKLL